MRKMLIIEDDELSTKVMRRIFQNEFDLFFCESADEYYEKYSASNFSIVIMDVSIKGNKSGLDLIKEIKAVPSYTGTPILCLTAHAQLDVRLAAAKAGSDLFITKPVNNKTLRAEVELLIKSKQPENRSVV